MKSFLNIIFLQLISRSPVNFATAMKFYLEKNTVYPRVNNIAYD